MAIYGGGQVTEVEAVFFEEIRERCRKEMMDEGDPGGKRYAEEMEPLWEGEKEGTHSSRLEAKHYSPYAQGKKQPDPVGTVFKPGTELRQFESLLMVQLPMMKIKVKQGRCGMNSADG